MLPFYTRVKNLKPEGQPGTRNTYRVNSDHNALRVVFLFQCARDTSDSSTSPSPSDKGINLSGRRVRHCRRRRNNVFDDLWSSSVLVSQRVIYLQRVEDKCRGYNMRRRTFRYWSKMIPYGIESRNLWATPGDDR